MCVKCIIDGGKTEATGIHLAESMKSQKAVIAAFQDRNLCPVPLTDAEWDTVIALSQEQCDLSDHVNAKIRQWNDALCAIAVAHSHGGEHRVP